VSKKVMTGEDTEQALREFSQKYNSSVLKESIDLIIIGLRSGGEVADLIERIVENVKQASFLKKELIASIMSYVIFISLISLFIAPVLFSLSYNLLGIMKDVGSQLSRTSTPGSTLTLGETPIEEQDFITFSKWSIVIISITSSMIIADLREGSIKASVKYVAVFIGFSYLVYIVSLKLLTAVFTSIVT
jgi:hypothetical protein